MAAASPYTPALNGATYPHPGAAAARENVNRILKDWTDRSLVSRHAGYYYLENTAAIQREVRM